MRIEQIYEKCLSQASYYIEHNGIAAVIDPLRDIDRYEKMASQTGAVIAYIFETHFHADFVSGHLELARATGAQIVFGPMAKTEFACHVAQDNETFDLNGIELTLLHTPGHTLESSCFLLKDEAGQPTALFTGDTLFLGDVGRPDLAQDMDQQLTQQDLAGMLFDSLRKKIMPLPDETIIYPGHGAGSACGKNMSSDTSGTLACQRQSNYALDENLDRNDFIDMLCENLPTAPHYFPMNVKLNSNGYEPMKSVIKDGLNAMSTIDFKTRMHVPGTLVLDVRSPQKFAAGHIPGSINIGLDGSFAPWAGAVIPVDQPEILLVSDPERVEETLTRLGRIGYHQCKGYLSAGIEGWGNSGETLDTISCISAENFHLHPSKAAKRIIDVRTRTEFESGNIPGSQNIPLSPDMDIHHLDDENPDHLVFCAGGYRSMIFISMLRFKGHTRLINVEGGYGAILKSILQEK